MQQFDPQKPMPFWKGGFEFTDGKGKEVVDNVSYSPNSLTVKVSRKQALDLIHRLSSQLMEPQEDEIELLLFGELEELDDY